MKECHKWNLFNDLLLLNTRQTRLFNSKNKIKNKKIYDTFMNINIHYKIVTIIITNFFILKRKKKKKKKKIKKKKKKKKL